MKYILKYIIQLIVQNQWISKSEWLISKLTSDVHGDQALYIQL